MAELGGGEEGGDDISVKNIFGETALHFAAKAGNGEAVGFLVGEREGDEEERREGGVTVLTEESALHYAMRRRVGGGGRGLVGGGGVEGVVEGVVGRYGEGEWEKKDVGGVTPRELEGKDEELEGEGRVCVFFSFSFFYHLILIVFCVSLPSFLFLSKPQRPNLDLFSLIFLVLIDLFNRFFLSKIL